MGCQVSTDHRRRLLEHRPTDQTLSRREIGGVPYRRTPFPRRGAQRLLVCVAPWATGSAHEGSRARRPADIDRGAGRFSCMVVCTWGWNHDLLRPLPDRLSVVLVARSLAQVVARNGSRIGIPVHENAFGRIIPSFDGDPTAVAGSVRSK